MSADMSSNYAMPSGHINYENQALTIDPDVLERESGFAMPHKYDRYYVNRYSFPKGLISTRRLRKESPQAEEPP